jgi:phosphomevalonate kinase
MSRKKKILVFSVPFSGHLNVIRDMVENYGQDFDFKIAITGWKNIRPDILSDKVTILAKSELHETDPMLWTFQRCSELLADCINIAKKFNPDLIIYDFFSLEGYFISKILGIPCWCSIPAMIGPFANKDYLKRNLSLETNKRAIAEIEKKFNIKINADEIETISDGFHIPAELNLIWSYEGITPENFLENRKKVHYVFIGRLNKSFAGGKNKEPLIYFSLGTVVMDNLWNQQPEVREKMKRFISKISLLWKDKNVKVVFSSQGKKILEKFPDNWEVLDKVDQVEILSRANLFITHGGSNSFHEAVVKKVPMIVIPFFGDQILVGKRVEELGLGINLVKNSDINTKKSKDFLDRITTRLDSAVSEILRNKKYEQNYGKINLDCFPLLNLLKAEIPFSEGDLLYGTNVAREKYVMETRSHGEFRISEFRPFFELAKETGSMPRIVDIYHDSILNDNFYRKDILSGMHPYGKYLGAYKKHLGGEKDLCKMCLRGLDFFSKYFRIHFILGDYSPAKNYITTREIEYILKNKSHFAKSVVFYKKVAGSWVPLSYEEVGKLVSRVLKTLILISGKRYSGKTTFSEILKKELNRLNKLVVVESTSLDLKKRFCKEMNLNLKRFIVDRDYKEKYREKFTKFVAQFGKEDNLKLFIKRLPINSDFIIINDLRTKYDLEALKNRFNVISVRINSDNNNRVKRGYQPGEYDQSSFENELDHEKFDFSVENNGSLKDLKHQAKILSENLVLSKKR